MDKRKVVTIADVAREARVSIATVSRVINKVATVKEANRLRVEEAINRLNYKPDPSAQRLAAGKGNTIGLLIPHFEGIFYSYYASELIRGVGAGATELGLDLLLHITSSSFDKGLSIRTHIFNPKYIAGILVADIGPNQRQLEVIERERIPYVLMNHLIKDGKVNCVAIDNKAAAISVAEHIFKLGHRRIATITGDLKIQCARQRLEGIRKGLEAKGVVLKKSYIAESDFGRPRARKCMEKLLAQDPPPTAVFVASDEMALEAIEVIHEHGLKVPEDISIVGFDDNPIATLGGHTRLTTVWQPLADMGRVAVEVLNQLIRGEKGPPIKRVLNARLVERDSCKPIK